MVLLNELTSTGVISFVILPYSEQGIWLRRKLKRSNSRWKIVYFHHARYSSGHHGSSSYMQWPFDRWEADAMISGHDCLIKDDLPA